MSKLKLKFDGDTQACKSEPISTPGTLYDENPMQNRNYGPAVNENNELIKMIETEVGVVTFAKDGKVDVWLV